MTIATSIQNLINALSTSHERTIRNIRADLAENPARLERHEVRLHHLGVELTAVRQILGTAASVLLTNERDGMVLVRIAIDLAGSFADDSIHESVRELTAAVQSAHLGHEGDGAKGAPYSA